MVDLALAGRADVTPGRPAMVSALSPSSMATWRQCPKRFFFEKIMRIETDPGEPAVCGSFVHLVLEQLMMCSPAQRNTETARRLASQCWPSFTSDPQTSFAGLGLGAAETRQFKHRAWAGISGYLSIEDPAAIDVFGTEQEISASLDGAPVHGIIDRIDVGEHGLVVTDYKSGKAPAWEDEREEKLRQLRTYAAMLEMNGSRVAELRLLFVSPQIAANALVERCQAAAGDALERLAMMVPDQPRGVIARAVDEVDTAQRLARAVAPDRVSGRAAVLAALEEASQACAQRLVGAGDDEDVAAAIRAASATRRRLFFARRSARDARPTVVSLSVRPADLDSARAEASDIWAAASSCYDSWEFPGRTGALCDWCPFATMCPSFQDWHAAGRPKAAAPHPDDPGSSPQSGSSASLSAKIPFAAANAVAARTACS